METKNANGLKGLIKNIKEEKDSRMAFFYSIFYFVFISILLLFGSRAPAQTPARFGTLKIVELKSNPAAATRGMQAEGSGLKIVR